MGRKIGFEAVMTPDYDWTQIIDMVDLYSTCWSMYPQQYSDTVCINWYQTFDIQLVMIIGVQDRATLKRYIKSLKNWTNIFK